MKIHRAITLSIRWLLSASRKKTKSGKWKTIDSRIANEFIEASKKLGSAVAKKAAIERTAKANEAFAIFAKFTKKKRKRTRILKASRF